MTNTFSLSYKPIPSTYSIGDIIETYNGYVGIIAQVMASKVCLILWQSDCNRMNNPVKVADVNQITDDEMRQIVANNKFTRLGRIN